MKLIVVPMKSGSVVVKYIIGTFPGNDALQPSAYICDYSPQWDGCIEYEVYAASGKEAKRAAIAERIKDDKKIMYT